MERLTLGLLSAGSSQSAGNTVASPDSYGLAQTAPGSPGILPPSPTTDAVVHLAQGPAVDYAPLITDGGEPGTRPGSDGSWGRPGGAQGGHWEVQ